MVIKHLKTKADFDQFLNENQSKLVVIDFTATWCGPCKRMSPVFETLSKDYTDVAFAKVDVDENEETAAACQVSAMPTFMLYRNKEKIESMTGANEAKLKELVEKHK